MMAKLKYGILQKEYVWYPFINIHNLLKGCVLIMMAPNLYPLLLTKLSICMILKQHLNSIIKNMNKNINRRENKNYNL